MLRNSFKFLSLALAASLTVAPVSAIGWGNSNSSRWGLAGLAVGIVYIAYKWCFSGKNTPEQKRVITVKEKEKLYDCIMEKSKMDYYYSEENFKNRILFELGDNELKKLVKELDEAKEEWNPEDPFTGDSNAWHLFEQQKQNKVAELSAKIRVKLGLPKEQNLEVVVRK